MVEITVNSSIDVSLGLVSSQDPKEVVKIIFEDRSKTFEALPEDLLQKYYVQVCFLADKETLGRYIQSLPDFGIQFERNIDLAYKAAENCDEYFLKPYSKQLSPIIEKIFREGMASLSTPEFSTFYMKGDAPVGCLTLFPQKIGNEMSQSVGWAWISSELDSSDRLSLRRQLAIDTYEKTDTKIGMGIYAANWKAIKRTEKGGFKAQWVTLYPL